MAKIKFIVKGKKESSTIYVRMAESKIEATARTGFFINPKYWNSKSGEVRQIAEYIDKVKMQNNLNKLRTSLESFYNEDSANGIVLTKEWLEFAIQRFKNPELVKKTDNIVDAVRSYQDELRYKINPKTNRPISQTHIRNYNTTIMRLQKFEQFKGSVTI